MGEMFGGCEGGLIQHSLHGADCTKQLYIQQQELRDRIPTLKEVGEFLYHRDPIAIYVNSMQARYHTAVYSIAKFSHTQSHHSTTRKETRRHATPSRPSEAQPYPPSSTSPWLRHPTRQSALLHNRWPNFFCFATPRRQNAPPCAYNPLYRTRLVPLHIHTSLRESLACPHSSSACAPPTSRGLRSSHFAMHRATSACKDGLP